MEAIEKRPGVIKREVKSQKRKHGRRFQKQRKRLEAKIKTTIKIKIERIKRKSKTQVHMLIIVERYREIKPVYQTIGRKFKKGIEEKPSKHIGYWRNKKIVNC